jgi:hypothetical protein
VSLRAIVAASLFACCAPSHAAERAAELVGSFSGRPPQERYGTDSYADALEVVSDGQRYQLSAYIVVTNREGGMERTSKTFWRWTGEGRLVGRVIRFRYRVQFVGSPPEQEERGSFRRSGRAYILDLDGAKYAVRKENI